MHQLPFFSVPLVLSWLEATDLSRTAHVCRAWRKQSATDMAWEACILSQWAPATLRATRIANLATTEHTSWRTRYRLLMRIRENWKTNNYDTIKLSGHTAPIYAIACNADFVFTASKDNTIRIWHIASRLCSHVLSDHTGGITAMLPDQNELLCGSQDGSIRIWAIDTGKEIRCLQTSAHSIHVIYCTQNLIFSGHKSAQVFIWDRETGDRVTSLLIPILPYKSSQIISIDVLYNNMAVATHDAIFSYSLPNNTPSLIIPHDEMISVRILERSENILINSRTKVNILSLLNGELLQSCLKNNLYHLPQPIKPDSIRTRTYGKFILEASSLGTNPRHPYPHALCLYRFLKHNSFYRDSPRFLHSVHAAKSCNIEVYAFIRNRDDTVLTLLDYASPSIGIPNPKDSSCVIS